MENEFENKKETESTENKGFDTSENENQIPFGYDYNHDHQQGEIQQNQNNSYYNQNNAYNQENSYGQNATYQAPDYGYHQGEQGTENQNNYGQQQHGLQNYNYENNQGFYNNQIPEKQKTRSKTKKVIMIAGLVVVISIAVAATVKAIDMLIVQPGNTALIENEQNENQLSSNNENNSNFSEIQGESGSSTIGRTSVSNSISSNTIISDIAEESMASMVSIDCTVTDTYNYFGQKYSQDAIGSGSGFLIGENENELFIATNNHVVEGANDIEITFIDEKKAKATTKGTDSAADLAVISVQKSDLKKDTKNQIKIASLGKSDNVRLGEMVVAIGNALGYGQSVTVGYISAKDREVEVNEGEKMILLQTDAAINPGNSGGALLNLSGEVIGIPSVKYADDKVEGMGFAIPISRAIPILDELMKREVLTEKEQGYLGVTCIDVTSDANEMYKIPIGAYVYEVSKDGAAKEGGVQVGDIITAINGMEISSKEALTQKVHSYRIGTEVTLTIQRSSNGKYKEIELKVKLKGKSTIDGLEGSDNSESDNSDNNDITIPIPKNDDNDGNGNNGQQGGNSGDIFGNGDDYYGNGSDDFFDFFNQFFN